MASRPGGAANANRGKIIDALMQLLAHERIEDIGFGAIARHTGLSLADCRAAFPSMLAVLAAYTQKIDRQVLAGGDADTAEEPPRERLFDVLMRRLETHAPHREAVRSLLRSATRNPPLAVALNGLAVQSQQWMLAAADISASGPKGMLRAQGLALLYASVLRTWLDDTDPGLARTMAALDSALARGQRWSGLLEDLVSVPARLCPSRRRPRPPRDEAGEETVAA
jgi:AcrR family transcriptional regulator